MCIFAAQLPKAAGLMVFAAVIAGHHARGQAGGADPRGVLADFGVTLPPDTGIRVVDSTAEVRYLVIPMRPAGTEGFDEQQLAALVTRDSMIGAGLALEPQV